LPIPLGTDLAFGTDLPLLPKGLRIIRFDKTRSWTVVFCPPAPYAMACADRDTEKLLGSFGVKGLRLCRPVGLAGMIAQGLATKRLT